MAVIPELSYYIHTKHYTLYKKNYEVARAKRLA